MKINVIGNELKLVFKLDNIQYVKSDDIAMYYEGRKGNQNINIKYVAGRVYTKIGESWSLEKGIIINNG